MADLRHERVFATAGLSTGRGIEVLCPGLKQEDAQMVDIQRFHETASPRDTAPTGLAYIEDTVRRAIHGGCDVSAERGDARVAEHVWCLKARRPKGDELPFATVFVDDEKGGYYTLYQTGWNNNARHERHYFKDRDDAANFMLFAISLGKPH